MLFLKDEDGHVSDPVRMHRLAMDFYSYILLIFLNKYLMQT